MAFERACTFSVPVASFPATGQCDRCLDLVRIFNSFISMPVWMCSPLPFVWTRNVGPERGHIRNTIAAGSGKNCHDSPPSQPQPQLLQPSARLASMRDACFAALDQQILICTLVTHVLLSLVPVSLPLSDLFPFPCCTRFKWSPRIFITIYINVYM